jgi:hypothetical protein
MFVKLGYACDLLRLGIESNREGAAQQCQFSVWSYFWPLSRPKRFSTYPVIWFVPRLVAASHQRNPSGEHSKLSQPFDQDSGKCSMKYRVAIWAAAGFLVASGWAVYFLVARTARQNRLCSLFCGEPAPLRLSARITPLASIRLLLQMSPLMHWSV